MRVPPIKATIKIDKEVKDVWKVIFNENGWDSWFTDGMKVELFEGGKIFFRWVIEGEEVIDRGINIAVVENRLWEFEWNEYEDGYRSRTAIKLHEAYDRGTWVEIEDRVIVLKEKDLEIAFSCAVGWGEFLTRLKLWLERGIRV